MPHKDRHITTSMSLCEWCVRLCEKLDGHRFQKFF